MREEIKYRQELVHFGKVLHEHGYVAATNATCRCGSMASYFSSRPHRLVRACCGCRI
jgi:hypothetical protein